MLKFLARFIGPQRAEFDAHRESSPGSSRSQVLRKTRSAATGVPPKKPQIENPLPTAAKQSEAAAPPAETGFDPYNTGAFDRGASWERVGKRNL